jgi:hypothetical protein
MMKCSCIFRDQAVILLGNYFLGRYLTEKDLPDHEKRNFFGGWQSAGREEESECRPLPRLQDSTPGFAPVLPG